MPVRKLSDERARSIPIVPQPQTADCVLSPTSALMAMNMSSSSATLDKCAEGFYENEIARCAAVLQEYKKKSSDEKVNCSSIMQEAIIKQHKDAQKNMVHFLFLWSEHLEKNLAHINFEEAEKFCNAVKQVFDASCKFEEAFAKLQVTLIIRILCYVGDKHLIENNLKAATEFFNRALCIGKRVARQLNTHELDSFLSGARERVIDAAASYSDRCFKENAFQEHVKYKWIARIAIMDRPGVVNKKNVEFFKHQLQAVASYLASTSPTVSATPVAAVTGNSQPNKSKSLT